MTAKILESAAETENAMNQDCNSAYNGTGSKKIGRYNKKKSQMFADMKKVRNFAIAFKAAPRRKTRQQK